MTASSETIARIHREAPLTDIHAHPSMKAWLFRRNLWHHYWSASGFDPLTSRTDFKMLEKGGVGVVWSALHLPERKLFKDCFVLGAAAFLLVPVYLRIMHGDPFERLLEIMDAMEPELLRRPDRTELAQDVADIERIRRAGKIAFVHTVEGAHVLGPDVEKDLETLARRGVAMITLTHFYSNGLAVPADGIPEGMIIKRLCRLNFGLGDTPALTDKGRTVLRKMSDLDMIVDVTHCNEAARAAVYAEVDSARPIVASHIGVKRYRHDPYNLHDDEIREIQRRNGGIGIIFMPYWLSSDEKEHHEGLPMIRKTMEHIHGVTGSWDHVMLGTDFDGFTDPPDDVQDASRLGEVTRMLLDDMQLAESDVKRILGGNAMRVLRAGWQ